MNPDNGDLLGCESRRRFEFPVTDTAAFLAHAAVAPLPRRVSSSMARTLSAFSERGQFSWVLGECEQRCRKRASKLLGVLPEEIAFAASTSAGLATVAAGWRLAAGTEVLISDPEFSSLSLSWVSAQRRGVVIRRLRRDPASPLRPDHVLAGLTSETRVVVLPTAHWISGSPTIGLCELWEELNARGVRLVLDAVQTLGALPVCGEHADVVVADGHKWLLGPQGFAILMVRSHLFEEIDPIITGWRSAGGRAVERNRFPGWATSAQRFEAGGLNLLGLVGLEGALHLLEDAREGGLVQNRIAMHRRQLVAGLEAGRHELLGKPDSDWSGIVAFRPCRGDPRDMERALIRADVVVSLRTDTTGRSWLRAAPHFYNSSEDIDRLLCCLRESCRYSTRSVV